MQIGIAVSLSIIATILCFRTFGGKLLSACLASGLFFSYILTGFYFVSDSITGLGIDESVLYHLSTGVKGAGFTEYIPEFILSAVIVWSSILICVMVNKILVNNNFYVNRLNKYKLITVCVFVSFSLYFHPATGEIRVLIQLDSADQPALIPETYILNEINFNPESKKKNIVYLYLESVERTYLDERLFPGLMPNLKALEKKAISFTHIKQVYGTTWTIGGLAASQCGVPLVAPSGWNSMAGVDHFLPLAVCLGDILSKHDYDLHFLGGASLDFGGKGNLFASHGFNYVEGLQELAGTLEDQSYVSSWGLYDDTLYSMAKDRFDLLISGDNPFALVLLTLDTHHPDGHMSKTCENIRYSDGSNPILNAVHCADKMAGDFIRHVKGSEAFEDTTLVVLSDHLAMRNTAWSKLQRGERRNLFMIFDSDIDPYYVYKPGSLLDVMPTVLNFTGFNIDAHGFGRNLTRSLSSLVEVTNSTDDYLKGHRDFLLSLWSFPQLDNGIMVDLKNKKLIFEDRYIRYPAILVMDEKFNITEIKFDFFSARSLKDHLMTLEMEQLFLWIDECSKTGAETISKYENFNGSDYCMLWGSLGKAEFGLAYLNDGLKFSKFDISNFFEHGPAGKYLNNRK